MSLLFLLHFSKNVAAGGCKQRANFQSLQYSYNSWTFGCCHLHICVFVFLLIVIFFFFAQLDSRRRSRRRWFKSILLFIKATYKKSWPAKTFLVGDTEPQIDQCFLNNFFFPLQFRVLLPLSTRYFHFKKKEQNKSTWNVW